MNSPDLPLTLEDLLEIVDRLPEAQQQLGSLRDSIQLLDEQITANPHWVDHLFDRACLNIDQLEDAPRGWWLDMAMTHKPQAIYDLLGAMIEGPKGSDMELWKWITAQSKRRGWVDILMWSLSRAHQLDPEDKFPELFDQTLHGVVTDGLFFENDLNKRIFEAITQKYDLEGLVDEGNDRYGAVDLLVAKIHFIESLGMSGVDNSQVIQNAEWMIDVLMRTGADIERVTTTPLRGESIQKALANPLHLACWLYERDVETMTAGVAITALLNCGADWQKVLAHRNSPQSSALAVLDRHPAVRRQRLIEVSKTKPQPRKVGKL